MPIALRACLTAALVCACKRAPLPAPAPDAARPLRAVIEVSAPADATVTASGLRTKVLRPGRGGEHPEPQDLVEIHFTGWASDGRQFDSSRERDAPNQFVVEQTIKGWSEGVQMMVVGEQRRIWVPPALAYGDSPHLRMLEGLPELLLLTSGPLPKNPLELLSSRRFESLISEWQQAFQFVVVDTPPVRDYADGLAVATIVGRVLSLSRAAPPSSSW